MTTSFEVPEFMAERPAPGEPRPYNFPDFEKRQLANGMKVIVAPVHTLPIVTVLVLVEAGASADPRGREGTANLVAGLLSEGTATMDGATITESFERLGAALNVHADWDAAIAKVTTLPARLPEAMGLLSEVLRAPVFPEREVERLRAERLSDILQQRAEPRGLAEEMFDRFTYSPDSRYALPADGDENSVNAITRDDVVQFHSARYRSSSATVVVAGDVTTDAAVALVEQTFGDWAGEAAAPVHVDDSPSRLERMTHLVHKAGAPQSEIRLGHVGLPRKHPDYFAVTVMNALLGGLFNSRLNLNLRERNGYTYGANSAFDWRRDAGPFTAGAAVQSEVTAAAVREALAEMERFAESPIPDEELSLALDYLEGVFPIRFETTGAIASALAGMVVYGLPDDYYDSYRSKVRAITVNDVRRAARAHLKLGSLQLVVVGDTAAVKEPLAELRFGELQVYDSQGNPIAS
ncbi:MAG TPA: pitrilysin family protein [Gemmatimonadales bacterium]|nr:pitrilysin family protein [Gemmatimonadales bacterium]